MDGVLPLQTVPQLRFSLGCGSFQVCSPQFRDPHESQTETLSSARDPHSSFSGPKEAPNMPVGLTNSDRPLVERTASRAI
ncbi:uncharacterized protein PADG_03766 [Paracoccidioides brasiliensis Pb18]|uniref:Uncharacterized protein n=1 Tax=Paracoccidioides brasiliensis (strain Pb18) TaxID=502780 RepID=C1G930_PARBD|nr:uncharacterized protein PADG_03766 [Paracoccidioides brasiliensis Pb18]EEH47682.2 hypothetical protein PADG_03766 [Paracoccidioides brasiliensis Pb18]ODH49719.1 hypothetical protein GX48_04097 [Paracoccidioides brasiliensis]